MCFPIDVVNEAIKTWRSEMTGRGDMTTRSGTDHYSNINEVIRRVERTLNGKVIWDEA